MLQVGRCPPEAFLRATFTPNAGEVLVCPKCEQKSLVPGAVEGCEVWHCTPCNGFLVERGLLMGIEVGDTPLEGTGFSRRRANDGPAEEGVVGYLSRMIRRIVFWPPPEAQQPGREPG